MAELAGTAFLVAAVVGSGIISAAFNPVITVLERLSGALTSRQTMLIISAQVTGGMVGVVAANLMFNEQAVSLSKTARGGPGVWLGEVIATAGLVLLIIALSRGSRHQLIGWAVGAYITAGYWFTSSTSFANPAVTIARMFSGTFAGIQPASVPMFLLAQTVGGAAGYGLSRVIYARPTPQPSPRRSPMNSSPQTTRTSAADTSGQPARRRVTDYDRLVDELAYAYEGIFSRDSIAQAVADARISLEPTATIPDFLPILVSRFAREQLSAAAQADRAAH